jgi:hypothetical protein
MDYAKIMATWWSGTCYHIEQLNTIISSTDIKAYAYILHDKDKQDNGEPKKSHYLADADNFGLKKPHYHFLVQLYRNQRGSWFKQFSTDDMGIVFVQPCYHPKSAFDYLIHDTPTAKKQNKYLYPESERVSTIDDFTGSEQIDESKELYDDLIALLDNQITWHELIQKKPKRIHMIANIKVAYDMLFYERYGVRYFEPKPYKTNKSTGEIVNHTPLMPKIELVPITDKETLDNMPF